MHIVTTPFKDCRCLQFQHRDHGLHVWQPVAACSGTSPKDETGAALHKSFHAAQSNGPTSTAPSKSKPHPTCSKF